MAVAELAPDPPVPEHRVVLDSPVSDASGSSVSLPTPSDPLSTPPAPNLPSDPSRSATTTTASLQSSTPSQPSQIPSEDPLPTAPETTASETTDTTTPPLVPLDQLTPTTTAPTDIIHSATPQSPSASEVDLSPKKLSSHFSIPRKKFSIFSPRDNLNSRRSPKSPTLRRLFSPSSARHTVQLPDDRESDASSLEQDAAAMGSSTVTPKTRRRRFPPMLCKCFPPRPPSAEAMMDADYGQHLKTMQPTYEPESPLLPAAPPHVEDRICLVLDLDETLVHSSFTPIPGADFEIPLEMQGEVHTVYVKKRPGVDEFLKKVSEWYEVVIFTASLALYANPVMDLLDPHNLVQLRLYREHCVLVGGCYVKDIAKLGRDLKRTFIIDNSPLSYVLQPENAIPITAFFTDDNDRELEKTLALLDQARHLKDVRQAFC